MASAAETLIVRSFWLKVRVRTGNRSGARRRLCIAAALAEAIEEVKAAAHLPPQSKKAESGREKAILRVVHMPVPVIPLLTNIFTSTLRF